MNNSASILPFKRGPVPAVGVPSLSVKARPIKIEIPPDLAQRVVEAAGFAGKTPEAMLIAFIHEGFPERIGAA